MGGAAAASRTCVTSEESCGDGGVAGGESSCQSPGSGVGGGGVGHVGASSQ